MPTMVSFQSTRVWWSKGKDQQPAGWSNLIAQGIRPTNDIFISMNHSSSGLISCQHVSIIQMPYPPSIPSPLPVSEWQVQLAVLGMLLHSWVYFRGKTRTFDSFWPTPLTDVDRNRQRKINLAGIWILVIHYSTSIRWWIHDQYNQMSRIHDKIRVTTTFT